MLLVYRWCFFFFLCWNKFKTPAEELNSLAGMILKRHMCLQLAQPENLYPDNPEKRERILKKYRNFILPVKKYFLSFCLAGLTVRSTNPHAFQLSIKVAHFLLPFRLIHSKYQLESRFTYSRQPPLKENVMPFLCWTAFMLNSNCTSLVES